MTNLVSVVIVNWNGAEVLPACLESLLKLNHRHVEIIVVDNGSTDDSIAIINRISRKKAKIVRLAKNVGFAAGVNVGVENAGGEFIATLNNDMVVEPTWLDQPLKILREDKSVGIISCRQMNYYDRAKIDGLYHRVMDELVFMPFVSGREFRENDVFHSKPGYVISANGGSAVIRAELFKKLGGYDRSFFGYMEETDFCMRAFLKGWRCAYAPNAVVYHMDGFSFKKLGGQSFYLLERNRIRFLYKNIPLRDIFRNLHYLVLAELRAFKESCLPRKNPLLYVKARWHALWSLWRYREIRKENVKLFRKRREEFYRLRKDKKQDFAR